MRKTQILDETRPARAVGATIDCIVGEHYTAGPPQQPGASKRPRNGSNIDPRPGQPPVKSRF
jgi:hypothetical protein